jgi:ubiquinone/menaquinone biosynthesis C-methylase UbiE
MPTNSRQRFAGFAPSYTDPVNAFENMFCSSSLWRSISQAKILPWLLSDCSLGDHVLEIGAGFGAATRALSHRAARVTSLEFSARSFKQLKTQVDSPGGAIVQADAAALPFANHSFSAVTAILVLHHLLSTEQQDRAFAESFRVLRPGGVFLAAEIDNNWIHRVGHIGSTFTPLLLPTVKARLTAGGFRKASLDPRAGGFRVIATA